MRRVLACVFASAFVMGTAAADEHDQEEAGAQEVDYARTGTYVSVGGAYAINAYRGAATGNVDDTWAVNGRIGYRATRKIALEVEFEYAHEFQWDDGAYNSFYVPGINVKYFFLEDRFQPYVIGGVNFAWTNVEEPTQTKYAGRQADWSFRMGAGLNIFATEKVAFYVEGTYLWGVGDLWNLDYSPIAAGIEYHF